MTSVTLKITFKMKFYKKISTHLICPTITDWPNMDTFEFHNSFTTILTNQLHPTSVGWGRKMSVPGAGWDCKSYTPASLHTEHCS